MPADREEVSAAPGHSTGAERWSSLRALWWSAALLAAVLTALLLAVDNGVPVVVDESVYGEQARALAEGSWWSDRPAPQLDPDGSWVPLLDSVVDGDRIMAYGRHPLYPILLAPLYRWAGYSGALAASAVGMWAASVIAAFCARRLDGRLGIPAMWVAASAGPLLFNGLVLWAHSLGTAAAGLTYLSVVRVLDGRRCVLHAVVAATAASATVLLRSEGFVFVVVLAAVVGATSLRKAGRWQITWPTAMGATTLGGLAVGVYQLDGWWSRSIGGGGGYGSDASSLVLSDRVGPLGFVWSSLLRPFSVTGWRGREMVIAATVLLVLAALSARVIPKRAVVPWCCATVAAVVWLVGHFVQPWTSRSMITGLLPAFPLLLVALVLVGRDDLRRLEVRVAGATFAVGVVALAVTAYKTGGTTEWGGRYLNVFLVPLVGPALAVVARRRRIFNRAELRLFAVPLCVLLLVPSVTVVDWIATKKRFVGREMDRVAATATDADSSALRPVALVWRVSGDGMSRRLWTVRDRLDALNVTVFRRLFEVLDEMAGVGHDGAVIVTDIPIVNFRPLAEKDLGRGGWRIDESASWNDDDLGVIVLRHDLRATRGVSGG